MHGPCRVLLLTLLLPVLPTTVLAADPPRMKFNEVREVAPGVFFRYSSISATDPSVVFGGSNHVWVVFEDYVVVIDANFPKEATDVIAAIRKTTDKPIRYVFDTHHHGDHAYGNAVFAAEGATVISQARCAEWLRTRGPKEFADAGKGPTGRPDVAKSSLKMPSLVFDDKLVLDDGKQRVEFLYIGHGHTIGDAVAYLPRQRILCTGDACLNGAFNYTGHADTASWIRVLDRMEQLDIDLVCPGHGLPDGKDLIARQKRYFMELRSQIQKGIDAGQPLEEIGRRINMPWYKEWTGVEARDRKENIEHVYAELTGRVMPWTLKRDFDLPEGPSPTKEAPGWKKPRRIVVPMLMPNWLAELKQVAPVVEFVPVKTEQEAVREARNADAVVGFASAELLKEGENLRWIQLGTSGLPDRDDATIPKSIMITDTRRIYDPVLADQAFSLLLQLTRTDPAGKAGPTELRGKSLLVVGIEEGGLEIARRGKAFGMQVRLLDEGISRGQPDSYVPGQPLDRLGDFLPGADVVVLACGNSPRTAKLIGESQLAAMKPSALLVNVADGNLIRTDALVEALRMKKLAGAGLDTTDPYPLPQDHPLRGLDTVALSPRLARQSPEARERQWWLWRENVRRFCAGEPLLCVVAPLNTP